MSLFEKNYLIGAFNLCIATLLAGLLGILLILQIKSYELNVSYSFSWRFFFYDPFASRLILIVILSMVANFFSAVITFSGLYGHIIESNAVIFSLTSLLWIVIYLATDYSFEALGLIPLIILVVTLIILLTNQLNRIRIKFLVFFITGLVIIVPILGRLTDDKSGENLPKRQIKFTD